MLACAGIWKVGTAGLELDGAPCGPQNLGKESRPGLVCASRLIRLRWGLDRPYVITRYCSNHVFFKLGVNMTVPRSTLKCSLCLRLCFAFSSLPNTPMNLMN